MRHRAKFLCRSVKALWRYGRFQIFWDFQKLQILTVHGPKCVIMSNFVQIGQNFAEIWPFFDFQDGGRPPSWIFKNGKF